MTLSTGSPHQSPHRLPLGLPWLVLLTLFLVAGGTRADSHAQDAVERQARALQSDWAEIFYEAPREQRVGRYADLLERVRALGRAQPRRAEPLIVEAIILCTYSGAKLGLDTFELLEQARALLDRAVALSPSALDGAAHLTLGNLYRRLPGWPILYGDKALARRHLEAALALYPDAIDTNYFMGEFLLEEGEAGPARHYLEKALAAPIRPSLRISDEKLRQETIQAMTDLRNGAAGSRSDFFSLFTPSFDR